MGTKLNGKQRMVGGVSIIGGGGAAIWFIAFLFNLSTTTVENKTKHTEHTKEHTAVNEKIDALGKHIDTRFDDLMTALGLKKRNE